MENMRHNPVKTATMTLKAFAKARSANPYKLMSTMNVIGEGADIHETAYVEASFIGRGARIGAGATVRNSFVGDGAVIADQSYLMNTNIGDGAFVTDDLSLIWCTVYPGASVAGVKTQMTLVGRDSYIGMWCSFLDAKFIGEIMVEHNGSLVSAGTSFLGSCVGHNCVMAGKVLIMPGRAIPNGTVMVTRPDECIMEIEPDLPRGVPLIRDNGRLVPLKR